MARPPRRGGLGSPGLERIRRELGTPLGEEPVLERALFGVSPQEFSRERALQNSEQDLRREYQANGISFSQDFDIFYVQKSDKEGLGPGFSTRVKSHIFIPDLPWISIYELFVSSSAQLYPSYVTGEMHVTWHKQSKSHTYTVYTNTNLELYRGFYNSSSKGRAVRDFEGSFYNA